MCRYFLSSVRHARIVHISATMVRTPFNAEMDGATMQKEKVFFFDPRLDFFRSKTFSHVSIYGTNRHFIDGSIDSVIFSSFFAFRLGQFNRVFYETKNMLNNNAGRGDES